MRLIDFQQIDNWVHPPPPPPPPQPDLDALLSNRFRKATGVPSVIAVAKTFPTYQYLAMSKEGGRDGRGTKVYYQGCEDFVQDTFKKTIYMNVSVKVHTRIVVVLEGAIPPGINK
jgi:hypothetical protein